MLHTRLIYLLPHHFLTGLIYRITRITWAPLKNLLIRMFINQFNVDMSIAEEEEIENYEHFNAFFTRAIDPDARPADASEKTIISPIDGTVSEIGRISENQLLQAKNRYYSLDELLAGDHAAAEKFRNGYFCTLYLSPRDYHRIHMPVDGTLQKMIYVPGRLFAVNPPSVNTVERLFARNERVISLFNTDCGDMALIMVGALFVGSMETVWAGQVTPADKREISMYNYDMNKPSYSKGEEIGRFNMGSTVILLFPEGTMHWSNQLRADSPVQMGKKIGEFLMMQPNNKQVI